LDAFVRKPDHLYQLWGDPGRYFWTGITANGSQAFIFVWLPNFVTVLFDQGGNLLSVEKRTFSPDTIAKTNKCGLHETRDEEVGQEMEAWFNELQFDECLIAVKRFFLTEYHVGIVDFPRCFQEVLLSPSAFSVDEQIVAQAEHQRWFREGVFVLWLNEGFDLWIAATGEIESS
jgi:hypothetical protein